MTAATFLFVGLTSIFSLARSYLFSIASRPANLPRRDALKGEAIVLPSSSVAKYTAHDIPAVYPSVGFLTPYII